MQSLCTGTDDVLHMVGDRQTAGDSDSEYVQRGHSNDIRQWRGRRSDVMSPVGSKDYFHTLCAVKLKVVKTGPCLHIVKLCYSAVNIYHCDDDVCIICVLAETVSRGDRAEISCGNNVGCGSAGGPLDDAG